MSERRGRRDSLPRSRWRRGPNRGRSGRQPLTSTGYRRLPPLALRPRRLRARYQHRGRYDEELQEEDQEHRFAGAGPWIDLWRPKLIVAQLNNRPAGWLDCLAVGFRRHRATQCVLTSLYLNLSHANFRSAYAAFHIHYRRCSRQFRRGCLAVGPRVYRNVECVLIVTYLNSAHEKSCSSNAAFHIHYSEPLTQLCDGTSSL
jgi:hypothetical protein